MTESFQCYDAVVVGAGLSGLTCAYLLQKAGFSVLLCEASDQVGGRIASLKSDHGEYLADLGPSWIWPEYQPIAARWLKELQVRAFAQYETGQGILDFDPSGQPRRHFLAGQHGIARIVGGPQALVDAASARLNSGSISLRSQVSSVAEDGQALLIVLEEMTVSTPRLIVAVPPRQAARIEWSGLLDDRVLAEMRATPTWMATQAKAVAAYQRPFWREAGLSGRVASRVGPMVEIHDHCGAEGAPPALFGFIGVPHEMRLKAKQDLENACLAQLARCFGPDAASPEHFKIEDWAAAPHIASPDDLASIPEHPQVRSAQLRTPHGSERIHFAGAEVSSISPGLLEGAFASAEHAVSAIVKRNGRGES